MLYLPQKLRCCWTKVGVCGSLVTSWQRAPYFCEAPTNISSYLVFLGPNVRILCRFPGARLKITFECYQCEKILGSGQPFAVWPDGTDSSPVTWKYFWSGWHWIFILLSEYKAKVQFCPSVSRDKYLSFRNITVLKSIFGCNSSQLCGW